MRRTAVPIVAALLLAGLAGCGAGANGPATRHFSSLCIDVGLPFSGSGAAAASGVLSGLRMQIPAVGLSVDGYRIRLCRVFDDGAGAQAAVAHAGTAAENKQTIAYVGELSGSQASVADAVLAQAGIALITPSGPVPAASTAASSGSGTPTTVTARTTALYLQPSAKTQSDAVAQVRSSHGCVQRRHRRATCTVLAPAAAPLCTGIALVPAATPPRFCVLAGPDVSTGWTSPAVAYGAGAGELLVSSLRAVAARGQDVADRSTVLRALERANVKDSPIGTIRFDAAGGIEADGFTAYTVSGAGGLAPSHAFRTH